MPAIVEHVWNTNGIVNDAGGFGLFLKGLFGYSGSPSLMQVFAYALYLVVALLVFVGPQGFVRKLAGQPAT